MQNNKLKFILHTNLTVILSIFLATFSLVSTPVHAAEDTTGDVMAPASTSNPNGVQTKKDKSDATNQASAPAELENVRAREMAGSKSPFSIQAILTYSGSTINHPLAEDLPNTGGAPVAPKVNLAGNITVRYRLDPDTSIGAGTGITTYTPFQGPSGTSVSDPVIDFMHTYKIGKIRNRIDFSALGYTDNLYGTKGGYAAGFTVYNEGYYLFPFGLTTGLYLELDANLFRGQAGYDLAGQTVYDFDFAPYFEYILSKRFNLRSVINIYALEHDNDMHSALAQYHPKITQSLGVGISIVKGWFIYPYLMSNDYAQLNTHSVTFGFSTIINLL